MVNHASFCVFFSISWQKLKISIHYYLYNDLITALLLNIHLDIREMIIIKQQIILGQCFKVKIRCFPLE